MSEQPKFVVGDWVRKCDGDREFPGRVAMVGRKFSRDLSEQTGPWRYMVQDDRGSMNVFSGDNLQLTEIDHE